MAGAREAWEKEISPKMVEIHKGSSPHPSEAADPQRAPQRACSCKMEAGREGIWTPSLTAPMAVGSSLAEHPLGERRISEVQCGLGPHTPAPEDHMTKAHPCTSRPSCHHLLKLDLYLAPESRPHSALSLTAKTAAVSPCRTAGRASLPWGKGCVRGP